MGDGSEREYDTNLIFKHLYGPWFLFPCAQLTKCIIFTGAFILILQKMHGRMR